MFEGLRKVAGAEPVKENDGTFSPSKLALKVGAPNKTNYDHAAYPNAISEGEAKVLVLCTEEQYLTAQNGKRFVTGNHPVELFVVLLHLEKAGFGIDLATITGASVKIENWAIPKKDEAVLDAIDRYQASIEKPLPLQDVIDNRLGANSPYVAVYVPGGHGATLGLPDSVEVKQVLKWAIDSDKFVISICHGPAAFLALSIDEEPDDFEFKDYKFSAFPDSSDKLMAALGYLPGQMPWYFGEKLDNLGMKNVSKIPSGTICEDRRLLSGDGPTAANALGGTAAKRLLESVNEQ